MIKFKYLIIGAGPTGIGAAYRLKDLNENDFCILESNPYVGGLASSFMDDQGFTWDIGGHVQFSHYKYFDDAMENLLDWNHLERESWVWIFNRFLPYPFQNNIRYLPKLEMLKCLIGLIEARFFGNSPQGKKPANFKEWILRHFGKGIADVFMLPYNFKVWAYPPEDLNYIWIGERVAQIDLKRIIKNILLQLDDISWGPNNTFRFPQLGGTGAIWETLSKNVGMDHFKTNHQVVSIDAKNKTATCNNGEVFSYDFLLSTIPVCNLVKLVNDIDQKYLNIAQQLKYSSTNIVGLGLTGPKNLDHKCWMYFPESDNPFYRATVFSNYSKNNVPDAEKNWSLMFEVSESDCKPVNQETLINDVINGAKNTKLINQNNEIVSTWRHREKFGYPTPSIERDKILNEVIPYLDNLGINSRGRFGQWRYEISNQDHSFIQGVEWADGCNNIRLKYEK